MSSFFDVQHLSVDRLLEEWRWLCPQPMTLIARDAFGNLFLREDAGKIFKLDVSVGQLMEVSASEEDFRVQASTRGRRQELFGEDDALAAAGQGLVPNSLQCIAFKIPLMFAESGRKDNAYLADLYEQVSFLGDLNRQLSQIPDGTKVRFTIKD